MRSGFYSNCAAVNRSGQFTIRPLPRIRQADEFVVAVFPDEFNRLPVFSVFIAVFIKKPLDDFTTDIILTISTGLEFSISKATYFNLAFSFVNISFSGFVSQLAAAALAFANCCTASLTVGTATADFSNGHSIIIAVFN